MKRVLVVLALTVAADLLLVAAAIGWVAVWSYLLRPGLDPAAYQAYAGVASPWVSVLAGMPVFHLGAKAVARRWGAGTVAAVVGLYIVLDVIIVAAFAEDPLYGGLMSLLSFATKIAAAWSGARAA